ncbi:STAS domain-containing protein [Streptomyces sp. NPDC057939]|uniref:STAS domain-containing protein n=1 Tax=Streptomyces sp. NPDC057939 TaxID=3346284 RepID=UPI0036EF83FD
MGSNPRIGGHTMTTFHVDVCPTRERTIIRVVGELDLDTRPQVTHATSTLNLTGRTLVMDLTRMTFIDSTGLTMLILLRRRAHAEGWQLQLHNAPAQALHVLDLTGTREIFTLTHPTTDERQTAI